MLILHQEPISLDIQGKLVIYQIHFFKSTPKIYKTDYHRLRNLTRGMIGMKERQMEHTIHRIFMEISLVSIIKIGH